MSPGPPTPVRIGCWVLARPIPGWTVDASGVLRSCRASPHRPSIVVDDGELQESEALTPFVARQIEAIRLAFPETRAVDLRSADLEGAEESCYARLESPGLPSGEWVQHQLYSRVGGRVWVLALSASAESDEASSDWFDHHLGASRFEVAETGARDGKDD
jgi:hypothetical protein